MIIKRARIWIAVSGCFLTLLGGCSFSSAVPGPQNTSTPLATIATSTAPPATSSSVTTSPAATSSSQTTTAKTTAATSTTTTTPAATTTAATTKITSSTTATTTAATSAGLSYNPPDTFPPADPDDLTPLTGTALAPGVTEEEATAFFADSVFIGDSVMMGFRNYVMYQQSQGNTGCMSSPTFLVSGSLSARTSLSSISDSSLHPLYKGQKRLIEDVIAEIGAKKVFILFGLNEVAVNGTEEPIRYLDTLISRILAQSPEVEIYLVSTTYMVQGSELEKLNNRNIRILNSNRRAYADALGYGYIDIANNVCDENGYLPSSYSSDQYVHQNYTSYAIWEDVLLSYASYNIAAEKGGAHAE